MKYIYIYNINKYGVEYISQNISHYWYIELYKKKIINDRLRKFIYKKLTI